MTFLVSKGADVNRRDKQGYPALNNAARRKDEDVVKALIGLKADVSARDQDGYTALDHAVLRNFGPGIAALAAAGPILMLAIRRVSRRCPSLSSKISSRPPWR
jgi:uncharacterized protein